MASKLAFCTYYPRGFPSAYRKIFNENNKLLILFPFFYDRKNGKRGFFNTGPKKSSRGNAAPEGRDLGFAGVISQDIGGIEEVGFAE